LDENKDGIEQAAPPQGSNGTNEYAYNPMEGNGTSI
jgi:hypothetical protein